tara:strand:- start:872 stop:1054 length:183 start_codon:yes stop_codon:yes gene_type:complete
MKRLLLPLLAAIALPTAVNAETYWLVMSSKEGSTLVTIPTNNIEECEASGAKYLEAKFAK